MKVISKIPVIARKPQNSKNSFTNAFVLYVTWGKTKYLLIKKAKIIDRAIEIKFATK